jgi:hypothetical protein
MLLVILVALGVIFGVLFVRLLPIFVQSLPPSGSGIGFYMIRCGLSRSS